MLKLKNIHYHPATAKKPVLEGINLDVNCGKPVIIAGASGSGKTSLIEVISGLASANKGSVSLGNKLLGPRERRKLSGVVFQFPERHFLGLTVAQELRLGHRRLSGEAQSQALKKVGLSKIDVRQAPEQLSGGQQRRLSLAGQLLRNPSILLLDEPTAGLDWSVRGEILELLGKLSKEQILIVVTHEPELFKSFMNYPFQLTNGRILKLNPNHDSL